jgi:hypothetical protein
MIPGKIRVPTLSFMPNETMTLPLPGSERREAQKHFLRSYEHIEKELTVAMERNWMQLFRALMGRRSCNSHLALTLWQVGPQH